MKRTKFMSHLLCGLLAGIGGYVYFLHVGSGSASHASGMEMNAIASSIIGGTMTGGVGNIIGTFFGVLSLSTIQNIVSSAGLDQAWWTGITIAAMLCLFLVVQSVVIARKKENAAETNKRAAAEGREGGKSVAGVQSHSFPLVKGIHRISGGRSYEKTKVKSKNSENRDAARSCC